MKIPLLTANDIDCRIQMITKNNSALVLLYKNARVDMRILDEVFGPMDWQREHQVVNNNLFCTISVWDKDKKAWICKQDVGVPSQTEAEKGQASDSFKRAGTCWGIGRELYDSPSIFISLDKTEIVPGRNGKNTSYAKFYVKSIQYDEKQRKFTDLTIVDEKGHVRYSLKPSTAQRQQPHEETTKKNTQTPPRSNQTQKSTTHESVKQSESQDDVKKKNHMMIDIMRKANAKNAAQLLPDILQEEYHVNSINKLTFSQTKEVYDNLDFIIDTALADQEDKRQGA